MHRDADLIHQKNVWMLKLLGCFFQISLLVHVLADKKLVAMQPLLGIIFLLILAGFVWSRRWPLVTMLLTITLLSVYLYFLITEAPSVSSLIFLGLLPLLSLFYQNYLAVVLAGTLYILLGAYFYFALHDKIFAGIVRAEDAVYVLVYGLFILSFSLIGTFITRKLSQRADQSEQSLKTILEGVSVGIWTYDFSTLKLELSDGFEQITGYPGRLFRNVPDRLLDIIHPDDQYFFHEAQKEMIIGRTSSVKECRILRPAGDIIWVQCRGTPYFNAVGHLVRLEGIIIEVTERKQLEETIHYLAFHDELTGLPNRTRFRQKFAEYAEKGKVPLALMFLDLDNFKEVNDTFGHEAGDMLLKHIAGRLSSLVRDQDMVCRLGGDEFVILLVNLDEEAVMKVMQRLQASLYEGYDYRGIRIEISASIGISISLDGTGDLEEMLRQADATMYDVKRGAATSFRYYGERSSSMQSNG